MTDDEIGDALNIMKQRVTNVAPMEMAAERHVAMFELIIDGEALLRGFQPGRSREEIEAALLQELET